MHLLSILGAASGKKKESTLLAEIDAELEAEGLLRRP